MSSYLDALATRTTPAASDLVLLSDTTTEYKATLAQLWTRQLPAADSTNAIGFYKADGTTQIGGWDTTNQRFAIGCTVPLSTLEVAEQDTAAVRGLLTGQYSTGTNSSRILTRKARGTRAVPVVIVTGDNLGTWVAEGYDGANYLQMGAIVFGTEGTIASTRVPTNIKFQTATDAAPSVLTTALTINSAQAATFAGQAIFNAPAGTKKVLVTADATGADNAMEARSNGGTPYVTIGPPALPTNSATTNWLNVTGTLPSGTLTATPAAILFSVTSAGSDSHGATGLNLAFNAGFTGAASAVAMRVANAVAGTGATYSGSSGSFSYRLSAANFGLFNSANGTTTGVNVGTMTLAKNGLYNYGLWTAATGSNGNASGFNIGLAAFATNTGTTPTYCAGFFALADYGTSAPAVTNAAIIADNGATSDPIARFRVNAVDKFTIDASGNPTLADAVNVVAGTTTGSKIGTAATQKLGFWNASPIVQPAAAGQAAVTDSTGGVAASSLVDVTTTAVSDPTKVNANFATVAVLLLAVRTALVNAGLMKGSA